MGGKNRHSQDRLFITATEWRNEHGGRKRKRISEQQSIGFEKCALSMTNYENPCCFEEGVIFEYTSLVNFVERYKVNPVSGREVNMKDILRLNMVMSVPACLIFCYFRSVPFF